MADWETRGLLGDNIAGRGGGGKGGGFRGVVQSCLGETKFH